ncbi:precorrin-8X methylmutase [Streptomyces canarius]
MNRVVHPIEQESYRRLRARLDTSHFPPLTRAVVERVIHSAADLEYANDLVMDEGELATAHAALHAGAPVVVDVEMVAAGITKTWGLAGLRIGYVLAAPEVIAELERLLVVAVSTPALAAAELVCPAPRALAEAGHAAHRIAGDRAHLVAGLAAFEPPAACGWWSRRKGRSCWSVCRGRPGYGGGCGSSVMRCGGVTRFRGSVRSGCASPCGTG